MLQKYKKQAKPYAATVFAGSDGGFGGRMAPPPPSWRAGDATDTPGLGFCRGAVMVVLPGAVVPDEGGDVIDDDDDISGGEIDGRAVVGPNQLELLLASALGVGRGGGGGGGAGSLLARHGFAAATVAAWCPSVPAHTSVLRVAVETAEGGDGQQEEEEEEGWQAVARDVGLGRPAPEPGAVCAQALSVTALQPGESLAIADPSSSLVNVYATLDKAVLLFGALMGQEGGAPCEVPHGPALWREWGWLAGWHSLAPAARREKLSAECCHELLFFLALRDPDFFMQAGGIRQRIMLMATVLWQG
ncbi:hypothetical protein MNEG_5973 [Monoraphidium neglectum]|uniref:Uncharacterized protein n=1 Tax=Monoraphidium neglectum TaxID=145388 RepID=A0A0D2MFT3_9CHLO|nr:hypothetical protein MNEG_5973 [Monoraphidium neglectum]KIZ01985.1 hypothetical protein MNEG_5973 [Monoraphidium neglectum]|eukprot:XP_013901004.1 hypothetical protein MNEG_5973 [Monoraphidium neglectum]